MKQTKSSIHVVIVVLSARDINKITSLEFILFCFENWGTVPVRNISKFLLPLYFMIDAYHWNRPQLNVL
jgi:hypothetical protein